MQKIKVVHHSKNIGYSGTDKTAQIMCEYLAKDERFEPFIVYRDDGDHSRLEIMRSVLGPDHIVEYHWKPGKKGRHAPYLPEEDNLFEVLQKIDPQIMHVHRSGYQEWPLRYVAPKAKWVETNIFGFADKTNDIDVRLYISNFIRNSALNAGNKDGPILYNPINRPHDFGDSRALIKRTYNIPDNAIMLGRVGRPDNFDPIALEAFHALIVSGYNAYYLVVNACDKWRSLAYQLEIQDRVRFVEPIIDYIDLSTFYSALDIYAHARSDGECCPCNIQEAMMHGLPVVTHHAEPYNGQAEIVGDAGFCVPRGDAAVYAYVLSELIDKPSLREEFGRKAKFRAETEFEASKIVEKLKTIYLGVL